MIEIQENSGVRRLITLSFIAEGNIFYTAKDFVEISYPTYTSIQIGDDSHIEEEIFGALNHSCDPNIFILIKSTKEIYLRSLRDIQEGEELTFFYPSTEWDMSQQFICLCKKKPCLKSISGAKYLRADLRNKYQLSDHILARHRLGEPNVTKQSLC